MTVGAMNSGTLNADQFAHFVEILYESQVLDEYSNSDGGGDGVALDGDGDGGAVAAGVGLGLRNSENSKVLQVEEAGSRTEAKAQAAAGNGRNAYAKSKNVADDDDEEEEEDDDDDDDVKAISINASPDDSMLRQVAVDIFNELRGSAKTVSVAKLKKWDDLVELVEEGVVSMSVIDALIGEVGVTNSKVGLDYDQFYQLFTLLGDIDYDDDDSDAASSDRDADEEMEMDNLFLSSRDDDTVDEVEEASAVYDELLEAKRAAGEGDALTVGDIFAWQDVAELLDSGALAKDNAVKAMTMAGVEDAAKTESAISFEQVLDHATSPRRNCMCVAS